MASWFLRPLSRSLVSLATFQRGHRSQTSSSTRTFGFYGYLFVSMATVSLALPSNPFHQKRLLASDKYSEELRMFRTLSNKRKLFEAFASIEENGEKFMTPYDILRTLSLERDSNIEKECVEAQVAISTVFQLADLNFDGRISFPEFMFFLRLLSTPSIHFGVAFNMFDLDESGSLELHEFEKVMMKQKGKPSGPAPAVRERSDCLLTRLFGKSGDGAVTIDQFTQFMSNLQEKVSKAQFDHYAQGGVISGYDLAKLLLSNANLLPDFVSSLESLPTELKRIKVTLKEYLAFQTLLQNLKNVDAALRLTPSTPQNFDKADFLRATQAVIGPGVTPSQIDILFHVLDTEGKGHIGRPELLCVVGRQENKFVESTKESGLAFKLQDFVSCVASH